MRIEKYIDCYYSSLLRFYKKIWHGNNRNEAYLNSCLQWNRIPDTSCDTNCIVVLNDENEVVGANFYRQTFAYFNDKKNIINWEYDTFLDSKFRKMIGLDFVIEINSYKNLWGHGLTEVNSRILKKLQFDFTIKSYMYIAFNLTLPITFFRNMFKPLKLDSIKRKSLLFKLTENVDEIDIPNNGFWNKEYVKVDFVRDRDFLNRRFYTANIDYYVYVIKNLSNGSQLGYIVLRIGKYHNKKVVSIVDYRLKNFDYSIIYKFAIKFSRINAIPYIICRTTFENRRLYLFPFRLKVGTYGQVVHNSALNFTNSDKIIITSADSDNDYLSII